MKFYELARKVSELYPNFRLYEWRYIERMKESFAELGMEHSSFKAKVMNYEVMLKELNKFIEELRKEKEYGVSDRLRDIISSRENKW